MFRKHDAGLLERNERAQNTDCQVRALSTSRQMSYTDAWQLLYRMQGERQACSFQLVEDLKIMDSRLGVLDQINFPAQRGRVRMTGRDFCSRFPKGNYILRMAITWRL